MKSDTGTADYSDTDDLIFPGNTLTYSCSSNTLTKDGKVSSTSAACVEDGSEVKLDDCFSRFQKLQLFQNN